ncbi:MAG: Cobyric acid synthase [Burkholderiaceae bacterium]|jgi:adenosylcobyric acid synthase|nr:MAG: Cobyric acid synthase [Burkholderiaceae bacterium]
MTRLAKAVMVLGTSSGAGKSWLATALCRHYARRGLKVAPFKAQNMSNNARVVAGPSPQPSPQRGEGANFAQGRLPTDAAMSVQPVGEGADTAQGRLPLPRAGEGWGEGGEIGAAQYFQALAARAEPEVRMNPLLLKPERDTHSQAVLLGQVDPALTALPWRERGAWAWPRIAAALDGLRAEHDLVVIEGAGSPAEINLMASDIVNLRIARHADARCLLVADVDRGGAFAHLYGTWALLPEADRARIRGFVLNKFRGDPGLLAPAPEQLRLLTGIPTVATIPMLPDHGLPEEDGFFPPLPLAGEGGGEGCGGPSPPTSPRRGEGERGRGGDARAGSAGAMPSPQPSPRGRGSRTIAIVAYPRISNLDEFQPLANLGRVCLLWARGAADLARADWVILPGSKHTSSDLAWLRARGLDRALIEHAARGGAVLGVCGGLQMLGEALVDPHGIDGNAPGLGLLPLVTRFEPAKTVRRRAAAFGALRGPWQALSGVALRGYEIHQGQTVQHQAMAAAGDIAQPVLPDGLAWQNAAGNVLGLYLHGLFEEPAVLRALFGAEAQTLETVFDRLADCIEKQFAPGVLDALIE